MKLHRFYTGNDDLTHNFWLRDTAILHQWAKVLRFQVGREVSLFNDKQDEKLYRISEITADAAHLELVTDMKAKTPANDIYLCFSLLKKDKNNWILQKGTELGVRHFVPLLCDRTEKTGFDVERAEKIVVEAAEQCGRVDIPRVREPISIKALLEELQGKMPIFVMEQGGQKPITIEQAAALIGPEGGWSDDEKQLFTDMNVKLLSLSDFTLRAETAAVTAAALLCK